MRCAAPLVAGIVAVAALGMPVAAESADICIDCLRVRVGPPVVIRGPFPDELDAPFSALRLSDGSFRGFSSNGSTYAIEGSSLFEMSGPRSEVLRAGAPGSINDCGRWLTSIARAGDVTLGLVHQEQSCDYDRGRTDKSMAIASSTDEGLTWTDLGTVITGTAPPQPSTINGEGDCTMVDGRDGFLYAYCLRNTDWQTIVARSSVSDPTDWHKYHEGTWNEPGLGGDATAIGFIGTGAGYLNQTDWVAAVTTDRWFGGVRLSVSKDKVLFVDLDEPLLPIDGADWNRPADTALAVYGSILNPRDGSNSVDQDFLLSYVYVPPGEGFESRYLVYHEVSLTVEQEPLATQVGLALTRWRHPESNAYVVSSGPLTGDRLAYRRDKIVAYLLTRAPEEAASVKLEECSRALSGHLDQMLAEDGGCAEAGYARERTAGWLYAEEQPETVPVYRCYAQAAETHFASHEPDCEGLGVAELRLGYGLAP
jgi:hypothetical protein